MPNLRCRTRTTHSQRSRGYLALGTMYNPQKKYDDAEKALKHGLELKPDVPDGQ